MKNIFDPTVCHELIERIDGIERDTQPHWGKMNAAQMFAHCALVFEYNNGLRTARVNPIMRLLLKGMMRKVIVGPAPYKRNSPTAPYFKIPNEPEFNAEKAHLKEVVTAYSVAGPTGATSIQHAWLGALSADEWSDAMYKHLDHHLQQFGC